MLSSRQFFFLSHFIFATLGVYISLHLAAHLVKCYTFRITFVRRRINSAYITMTTICCIDVCMSWRRFLRQVWQSSPRTRLLIDAGWDEPWQTGRGTELKSILFLLRPVWKMTPGVKRGTSTGPASYDRNLDADLVWNRMCTCFHFMSHWCHPLAYTGLEIRRSPGQAPNKIVFSWIVSQSFLINAVSVNIKTNKGPLQQNTVCTQCVQWIPKVSPKTCEWDVWVFVWVVVHSDKLFVRV